MHIKYPIKSQEIEKINIELLALTRQYDHASSADENPSVKEDIRLEIKKYQKQLQDLKEISLVLTDSGQ